MLVAAREQLERSGTRAGNLIAYCVREALMSMLDMAGRPERRTTNAATRVIRVAEAVRREPAALGSLLDAVQELAAAIEGPGPHIARLEALIGSLARRPAVRAEADLLQRYAELIDDLNALHADVSLDRASELYSRALATLALLFGPMTARLDQVEPLTAIAEPTPEDVAQLASLAGDPRTIGYFFSRLEAPGWLQALADHPLLQPPAEGPWFAYGYVSKLAQSHPAAVVRWLGSRPRGRDLADHQAYLLISIARSVEMPTADAVLHIATGRTGDPGVLHQLGAYLGALAEEELISEPVIGLLKRALDGAAWGIAAADDTYLSADILQLAITSAALGDASRWLGILTAKLAAASDSYTQDLRYLGPIDDLTLTPDAAVLNQFVVAIRDVAHQAATQGTATDDIVARLERLPDPLSSRLTASHLIGRIDIEGGGALRLLTEEVAHHDPMPETLRLLREFGARDLPELEERMLRALGDPPSSADVEALDKDETLPDGWIHTWSWLIAMPAAVGEVWSAANNAVQRRYGAASPNGGVWPEPSVVDLSRRAEVDVVELAALDPLEAADRIASWEPDNALPGNGRYSAGMALHGLVIDQPQRWLAQPQVALIETLRDPVLVERYLRTLVDRAEQLNEHVPAILQAVEFAEDRLIAELESGESGSAEWDRVVSVGIELIGKLAEGGARFEADIVDRGWALIERAAGRRDDSPDLGGEGEAAPFQVAIYRGSMRALDTAFVYAHATIGDHAEPARLLALLDDALGLEPPDGLHARAIIGRNLAWLAARMPEWTCARWEVLVGEEAPAGLGPGTFEQYLEWGPASAQILNAHPDLYRAALNDVPDHARRHLLQALIWGLQDYDAATVLDMLATTGDTQVSESIHWLAFGAFHQAEMPLEQAIDFLRLALERGLPGSVYESIGWLARVDRIDGDTWLDLTLSATQAAHGQLNHAGAIANRANGHPDDERAIRIVAGLLEADIKLWHLQDVGRVGLQLLQSGEPSTRTARAELREQLLRREFFDAR
jgi:hypothetical protein